MKSGVFQDAVESSTRVFGRKEVRVIFQGDDAETTGATVVLPALPQSAEISIDQADVIRGYRDHEAMHVRCTDTSQPMLDKLEEMKQFDDNLFQLAQYCEDIRIEQAGIQEYVGMRHNLSAVNKHAAKGVIEQLEALGDPAQVIQQVPPILQFRVALQSIAREKLGIDLGAYSELNQHIAAHNPRLYDFAEQYADEMLKLPTGYENGALNDDLSKRGTKQAFSLAKQIYDAYGEFERNPPPPPPPPPQPQGGGQGGAGDGAGADGQGDGNDQGDGDAGSGNAQGKGGGSGQQPGQGGGSAPGTGQSDDGTSGAEGDHSQQQKAPPATNSGGHSGAGGGGDRGNSTYSDEAEPPPPQQTAPPIPQNKLKDLDLDLDYKAALKDVVEDINGSKVSAGEQSAPCKFRVFAPRFTISTPFLGMYYKDVDRYVSQGLTAISAIDLEITNKRAMIRRILELELQARFDRHWQSGHKSGRLHSVRLVDAIQGKEAVFQKREDGKDMDTLLRMDIDASGSMAGLPIRSAVTLAYALTEALERTGCDIEVNLFTDSVAARRGAYTADEVRDAHDRWSEDYTRRFYKPEGGMVANPVRLYCHLGVLTMRRVKGIRDRSSDPKVRASFGLASSYTTGGTPGIPATFHALKEMAKEQHAKKVYLQLTDGQPDHPLEEQKPSEIMKEAQTLADSLGIHMIGVGINGCKVGHLFRDHIDVSGADAYEPVIRRLAKLVSGEAGRGRSFRRAA